MTGAAAGSAVLLADSMHCVAVLAEETKPVSTGTEARVEDHDCASRFRLDPTHSLLLRRHLGRNLITLFSTVNTPREKKTAAQLRDAPCERWIDARTSDAHACKAAPVVEAPETKHLFSSGFVPGMIANRVAMELASAVDAARGERIRACECIA